MSQDIRSFFTVKNAPKKPEVAEKNKKKHSVPLVTLDDEIVPASPETKSHAKKSEKSKKSKTKIVISSDDDAPETPVIKSKEKRSRKRKTVILSSDSESEVEQKKSRDKKKKNGDADENKLKPISVADMFSKPLVRKESVKKSKKEVVSELDVHSDEDFQKTIMDLDELVEKVEKQDKSEKLIKNDKDKKITESNEKKDSANNKIHHNDSKINLEKNNDSPAKLKKPNLEGYKIPKNVPEKKSDDTKIKKSCQDVMSNDLKKDEKSTKKTESSISESSLIEAQKKKEKRRRRSSESNEDMPKQKKSCKASDDTEDSGMDPDQERYERKQHSAALYQKYLQRGGPRNPGSKEIPEGKPNCLQGLIFIITGVLESLERDEAKSIIEQYGGKVNSGVTKKVNYLVAGEDAGPAKLEKATNLGLQILSEDELLDLIREKSDIVPKNKKHEEQSALPKQDLKDSKNRSHEKSVGSVNKTKSKFLENSKQKTSAVETSKFFSKGTKTDKDEIANTKDIGKNNLSEHSVKAEPKKVQAVEKQSNVDVRSKTSEKQLPTESMAWVEKYKPTNIKQIVGQQTDSSCAKKLMNWLKNWHQNRDPSKKLNKPSPWAKSDDGAYFRAALLSGSPGVGKTTTATLVCKELGFDTVEFNASDTRSKKLLQERVSELLSNQSLAGYITGGSALSKNHVLLMDEVDGMAGNEDRGGMQELIMLIKNSSVPIICMCNDRQHPKVRSLSNYCFDLRFAKPRLEQIRGAMLSVCFKEGIKIRPDALDQIIMGTGNDLRQTLNHLSMWSTGETALTAESAKQKANNSKKDIKLGPWEVIRKVFSADEHKHMSIRDKSDLFFYDYSIGPLFVQENYLQVLPKAPKKDWLRQVAEAADGISMGDLVDSRIRGSGAWSMLPLQAMYSSVIPGAAMSGHIAGQINFPGWLGKNSKRTKFQRLVNELQIHMRLCISGSRRVVNLDYLTHIRDSVVRPLAAEDVEKALEAMQAYHLHREDLDSLVEMSQWPRRKDPMALVNGKVKAAFTRAFNKTVAYATAGLTSKKKAPIQNESEDMLLDEEADEIADEEEEDTIDNDALIKAKKQSNPKASTSKGDKASKPSTSSRKTTGTSKPRAKKNSK